MDFERKLFERGPKREREREKHFKRERVFVAIEKKSLEIDNGKHCPCVSTTNAGR